MTDALIGVLQSVNILLEYFPGLFISEDIFFQASIILLKSNFI